MPPRQPSACAVVGIQLGPWRLEPQLLSYPQAAANATFIEERASGRTAKHASKENEWRFSRVFWLVVMVLRRCTTVLLAVR